MRDNIYDYLISYGFTKENLKTFEKVNDNMFFVHLKDVEDNITFLESKGLAKEDIIKICNNSPFMLTIAKNRREAFDEIYNNKLRLTANELITLIKNNNNAYVESPVELNKIIDYMLEKYSIENIKNIILANTRLISMKLDQVKKIMEGA